MWRDQPCVLGVGPLYGPRLIGRHEPGGKGKVLEGEERHQANVRLNETYHAMLHDLLCEFRHDRARVAVDEVVCCHTASNNVESYASTITQRTRR